MRKPIAIALALVLSALTLAGSGTLAGQENPFDLLIRNARIVDGGGNPWYRGDVGIRGTRIAEVG